MSKTRRARGRRAPVSSLDFLAGGGETGARMRALDWARTPLGAPADWPRSLKTSVSLMLNSQQPLWIGWGPEATFLYNDAYIQVLSLAKHPWALGQPFAQVWAEIWDIICPLADKVFQKGEASFVEDVRLFMSRGNFLEEKYYSFSYSPIRDESGGVGGLFCSNIDATPKVLNARRLRTLSTLSAKALVEKTAESACASAAATLASNPDDIPFALLYLRDEPGEHAVLAGCAGISTSSISLAPPSVELTNTGAPGQPWPIAAILETARSQVLSVGDIDSLPLGSASQRVSQAVVQPLITRSHERPVGVLIAGVNPTRKLDTDYGTFYELVAGQIAIAIQNARAAEEERRRADALAELDRAKTAFFSNVSHEFRTPLTLMLGPVADAIARADVPFAARERLEVAHRNALRLQKLVNSLLDFSRIEAGRAQASYEPADLAALTRDLTSTFRSAMEKAGLAFTVDCPPLDEPVYVDREMWEKIVLNLLSNAFKFTLEGTITVRMRRASERVFLEVQDTGVGVPPEELPRLFERFHRVERTQGRTHEGSGIGLALVQELVKLHGGTIEAESELGRGTSFRVRIPLGSAHLPKDRVRAVHAHAASIVGAQAFVQEALRWLPDTPEAAGRIAHPESASVGLDRRFASTFGARIVLADDNADMRAYVRELLSPHYAIEPVADGEAALAAIRRERPALVLTDVMMPRLDGFGLLRVLRADLHLHNVPVILLSARAGEDARVEGLDAGADDYLIKPFAARELVARVGALLERKQAEEALRRTQLRLESALEAGRAGTWSWDLPANRIFADETLARFFSVDRERAATEGVALEEFLPAIHAEDRPRVEQAIAEAIEKRGEYKAEFRVMMPDGSHRWLSGRGRVECDEAGEPVRFAGISVDVTERKRVEAQRQQFFNLNSALLVEAGFDGRLHRVNPAWERLLGWTVEEMTSRPWLDFVHPDDQAATVAAAERLFGGNEVVNFENRYRHKDGSWRWISWNTSPSLENQMIYGVAHDVTERKLAAKRLAELASEREQLLEAERAARAESESAMRAKDDFLATLSHELRTPLSNIVSWGRVLERKYRGEDEQLKKGLAIIVDNAMAQSQLISDLLDMSRIVAGKISLDPRPIDLVELVSLATNAQRPAAEAKRVTLSLEQEIEVGPLLGDATRLQQVLWNLLSNAIKFTPAGGRVWVHTHTVGRQFEIEVRDSGEGIAPAILPHIFDRFRQADSGTARRHGGLGLGLAIVKQLVELHDGAVDVSSEGVGRGATFRVRLPIHTAQIRSPLELSDMRRNEIELSPESLKGYRVLAVEDQADMLEYVRRLLEEHGAEVIAVASGYAALESLRASARHPAHVLVTDLGMPGMDGYQLLRAIREELALAPEQLPAIAVTAFVRDQDRERSLKAGFQAHLAKPYQVAQLVSVVRQLAGGAISEPS